MAPRVELPVAEIVERYEGGENTRALGHAYGVGHATVWRRLRAAGAKMRTCGGPVGNKSCLGRYKRGGPLCLVGSGYLGTHDREGEQCYVHRACWEAYHGPVPSGYVVHHRDGDRQYNEIENLACMPRSEHVKLHNKDRPAENL